MKKFVLILAAIAVWNMGTVHNFTAEGAEDTEEYRTALAVAKALDILIRSTRAKYTKDVVIKLKKDGVGASIDSASKKGFVLLPAQYIRSVAFDAIIRQKKDKKNLFEFFLRSRWNLNPGQGLQDDFEKDGWRFLSNQQEGVKKFKNIKWKPYVRVETIKGKKTLRYLSADPGAASACVSCHNKWEKKDEIKRRRRKAGIEEGKVFRMHELMGALAINIPLK